MFFSVRNTIKIAGKVYKPCICYEVTDMLELTVNKLVAEEKADMYKKYVYFCNGKVVEAKEEKAEPVAVEKKKVKKEKTIPVKGVKELAEEAEIISSPEEIAEGF